MDRGVTTWPEKPFKNLKSGTRSLTNLQIGWFPVALNEVITK